MCSMRICKVIFNSSVYLIEDRYLGGLISQISIINKKVILLAQVCFLVPYFLAFHCLENYSCRLGVSESFKMLHKPLQSLSSIMTVVSQPFVFHSELVISRFWYFISVSMLCIPKFITAPLPLLSELMIYEYEIKKSGLSIYKQAVKIPTFKNQTNIPSFFFDTSSPSSCWLFEESPQGVVCKLSLPILLWTDVNQAFSYHVTKTYPSRESMGIVFKTSTLIKLNSSKPTLKFIQLVINLN